MATHAYTNTFLSEVNSHIYMYSMNDTIKLYCTTTSTLTIMYCIVYNYISEGRSHISMCVWPSLLVKTGSFVVI